MVDESRVTQSREYSDERRLPFLDDGNNQSDVPGYSLPVDLGTNCGVNPQNERDDSLY
jgi:hypothetical protein